MSVWASRSSRRHSGGAERQLALGKRHVGRHRPVAREHAGLQELARRGIGGELAVAELVAFANPPVEELRQVVDVRDRDAALDLLPALQPQRDGRHRPEQAVAADRQREQPRVDGAAADLRHGRPDRAA